MGRLLIAATLLVSIVSSQPPGAKAMFYESIKRARPSPQSDFVGVQFWFENAEGRAFSEDRAASVTGSLTLHLRSNAPGFVSVWAMDGVTSTEGVQLLYRQLQRGGEESIVRGEIQFTRGESPKTLIVIFGRSETEQANSPASARRRFEVLSARTGPDGTRLVVRESDDVTSGEIGTYVVNRRGMPLATEIVLRR